MRMSCTCARPADEHMHVATNCEEECPHQHAVRICRVACMLALSSLRWITTWAADLDMHSARSALTPASRQARARKQSQPGPSPSSLQAVWVGSPTRKRNRARPRDECLARARACMGGGYPTLSLPCPWDGAAAPDAAVLPAGGAATTTCGGAASAVLSRAAPPRPAMITSARSRSSSGTVFVSVVAPGSLNGKCRAHAHTYKYKPSGHHSGHHLGHHSGQTRNQDAANVVGPRIANPLKSQGCKMRPGPREAGIRIY